MDGQTKFTPFSMRSPIAHPTGPMMQGMQVAPPGYHAPVFNHSIPAPNMSNYPTAMQQQLGPRMYGLPNRGGAPTIPVAGAQPVQGMQSAGQPPTGMNPQYQQALVSSLRNSGQ